MYKILIFLVAIVLVACEGKHSKLRKLHKLQRQGATDDTLPDGGGVDDTEGDGTEGDGSNAEDADGNGEKEEDNDEGGDGEEGGEGEGEEEEEEEEEPNWNGKGKPSCIRCIYTIVSTGEEYFTCGHNATKCPSNLAKDTSHLKIDDYKSKNTEYQMVAFQEDPTFKFYSIIYKEKDMPVNLIETAVVLNPSVTACANCTREYLTDKSKDPWTSVFSCTFRSLGQCPAAFSAGAFSFEYDVVEVKRIVDSYCLCLFGDTDERIEGEGKDLMCVCTYETFD
ncbi:uncharacterized protein LOC144433811 [Glandiceps talaboti]